MATDGHVDHPRAESLSAGTLHLVIDMQRLFAEGTAWASPSTQAILPAVTRLSEARSGATVFARFVPARTAAAARGRWQRYYERWESLTLDRLDPALLDLLPPLAGLAQPGSIVDKEAYSAFSAPGLEERLRASAVDTLVVTGVETDACVLATVLDAVDLGFRVIVPADAVASGSEAAHRAVLEDVLPRLSEQVEISTVEAVLQQWPA